MSAALKVNLIKLIMTGYLLQLSLVCFGKSTAEEGAKLENENNQNVLTYKSSEFLISASVEKVKDCYFLDSASTFKEGENLYLIYNDNGTSYQIATPAKAIGKGKKGGYIKVLNASQCEKIGRALAVKESEFVELRDKKLMQSGRLNKYLKKFAMNTKFGLEILTPKGLSYLAPLDDGKKIQLYSAGVNVTFFPFFQDESSYVGQMIGVSAFGKYGNSIQKSDIKFENSSVAQLSSSQYGMGAGIVLRFPYFNDKIQTLFEVYPYTFRRFLSSVSSSLGGSPIRNWSEVNLLVGVRQVFWLQYGFNIEAIFRSCPTSSVNLQGTDSAVSFKQCYDFGFDAGYELSRNFDFGLGANYLIRSGSYSSKDESQSIEFMLNSLYPNISIRWKL